jgi:hypothetical protein
MVCYCLQNALCRIERGSPFGQVVLDLLDAFLGVFGVERSMSNLPHVHTESSLDGARAAEPNALRDRRLVYDYLLEHPGSSDDAIWRSLVADTGIKEGTFRRARRELSLHGIVETLPEKVRNPVSGVRVHVYQVVRSFPDPWPSDRGRHVRAPQFWYDVLANMVHVGSNNAAGDAFLGWARQQFDRGSFPSLEAEAEPEPDISLDDV